LKFQIIHKDYDIHIIPKSRLFDDSFSNKTIYERQLNIDKSIKLLILLQEKLSAEDFDQFEKKLKFVW
jgi:CRISPR-associated endonuclease Csn1